MYTEGEGLIMSMEMDLFATPEKQRDHPSVSLEKTPVRRKLTVDDDNEIGSVYFVKSILLILSLWFFDLELQCIY